MIERLELKNILSFGPDAPPIELRPLNILIGPNGSGKSNLLDVLALLRSMPESLRQYTERDGPAREWIWSGVDDTSSGERRCEFRSFFNTAYWSGIYEAELVPFPRDLFWARHERIATRINGAVLQQDLVREFSNVAGRIDGQTRTLSGDADGSWLGNDSILSQLKDPVRFPSLAHLSATLSAIALYRVLPYGRAHSARKAQTTEFLSGRLREDGSNLNQVLVSLRKNSAARRTVLEALAELNPAITEFNVDVQANQTLLYIEEDGRPIPASRISDGLLRMLCLMAILLDPDAKGTICLEEPEVGLHPDAILLLAKMLKEASSRCQVIVTTHSEVLVDCFSDEPESIVVCERENGSTTMRRLEREPLKKWLEEYSLAQLWSKGVLEGNRW